MGPTAVLSYDHPDDALLLYEIYQTMQNTLLECKSSLSTSKKSLPKLSTQDIQALMQLCGQLTPEHLGLKVPLPHAEIPYAPVKYQHIYTNEHVSVGIFILPKGSCIPLHDHPDMTVISHVLYGQAAMKSYDFICSPDKTNSDQPNKGNSYYNDTSIRLAHCLGEKIINNTTYLQPEFGNLHEIHAVGDIGCAFFDIAMPKYDSSAGRDCTYYKEIHLSDVLVNNPEDCRENITVLETYNPSDFMCIPEKYCGPRFGE